MGGRRAGHRAKRAPRDGWADERGWRCEGERAEKMLKRCSRRRTEKKKLTLRKTVWPKLSSEATRLCLSRAGGAAWLRGAGRGLVLRGRANWTPSEWSCPPVALAALLGERCGREGDAGFGMRERRALFGTARLVWACRGTGETDILYHALWGRGMGGWRRRFGRRRRLCAARRRRICTI